MNTILCAIIICIGNIFGQTAPAAAKPEVLVGYYPGWKEVSAGDINFNAYTHINVEFASLMEDGSVEFNYQDAIKTVQEQVGTGNGDTKLLVSVGGWNGSGNFSQVVADEVLSSTFVTEIAGLIETNGLAGVDLDWEYPGRLGCAANTVDPANDTYNYLAFLKKLRAELDSRFDKHKLVTMAVRIQPFDVDGKPSTDISGFAEYVDYISLMQFDMNGPWSEATGPNAPLDTDFANGSGVSFNTAIEAWTDAGWPASKLVAGFAFYGRAATAIHDMNSNNPSDQYQAQSPTVPQGPLDRETHLDPCTGNMTYSGIWSWESLRQTVLSDPLTVGYTRYTRHWDTVSQTPWLFDSQVRMFISYDDTKSIGMKVDSALASGLLGAMVWSMEMDYQNELVDVIVDYWNAGDSASTDDAANAKDEPADIDASRSGSSDTSEDACRDVDGLSGLETLDDVDNEDDHATFEYTDFRTTDDTVSSTEESMADGTLSEAAGCSMDPEDDSEPEEVDGDGLSDTPSASPSYQQKDKEEEKDEAVSTPGNADAEEEGACSIDGAYECEGASGTTGTYRVCVNGSWLTGLPCGPGTYCVESGGSILCGWSQNK
ncbi:hypothetical protein H4217_003668 [Coemansia sp. RSA 1939]|nr:hypothetical protein H4217_003668 [Coemansia sp. RSA 1939]KAJ2611363.1 hypothetical protein EV177_003513 [Coemansia sp. RSA 1804]KAJ2692677.1 hypothetical protein GGH99_001572 [Coemansia sp. RSA 1285]